MTDPGLEASRGALRGERLRSVRFLGVFRFVGISIACAMNVLVPVLVPRALPYQSDLRLFACYWLVAAVLRPAETKALYFVADGSGGHVFAATLAEHQANVSKWFAIRRARGQM